VFRIYPAVDVKGGRCVRLFQGDLSRETVFSDEPWEVAARWEAEGASYLHVVDLDGAVAGRLVNLEVIRRIMERVNIPVQVGGGVRREEDIRGLLDMGAARVILGTRALAEPRFLERVAGSFGDRVLVSLDTRGDRVAVQGWTETLPETVWELVRVLRECGVRRLIHTDVQRDGTLTGYRADSILPLLEAGMRVIAAGGISSLRDLENLKELVPRGVEGAVVGRALYSGDLRLGDILPLQELE